MSGALAARTAWVQDRVRDVCFANFSTGDSAVLTLGAELELLVVDARTHAVVPIFEAGGSLDMIRLVGSRLQWQETVSAKGVPRFVTSGGGSLTFEPGGQLEYASAVHGSVDAVLQELCVVETALRGAAEEFDVALLACGVDPFNGPADAPLQLRAARYQRMADYFEAIGPDGARMMRQTASVQLNVGGVPLADRWGVANAMTPWLVALFANSSHYAKVDTGCASFRAETWRGVDGSRTGLLPGADPVREYADFALGARAFLADASAPPFATLDESLVSDAALDAHLSSLFPEVRARGYLEFRSIDAVDGALRTAALTLVTGLIGDATAARDAGELLGPADASLLRIAGQAGMRESVIAARAADLVEVALEGCGRLGCEIVSEEAISFTRAALGLGTSPR